MGMLKQREYLNERHAAQLIDISPSWLQKLRLAGVGPPHVRVGPRRERVLYPVAQLRAWIKAQTQSAGRAA